MRCPIAIEPGDARHSYGVIVPDLPGCFSAGDTLDAAVANAEEAIRLYLEARVNITLPDRLLDTIDRHAKQFGETRSGFLARAAIEAMSRDAA